MKSRFSYFLLATALVAASLTGCKKDDETLPEVLPSDGKEVTLDGGTGGANAENEAFMDMSTDGASTAKRASWDVGFYTGTDFRVILNNTTAAGIKVTTATDLANIGAADTIGLTLATSQLAPEAAHYAFFDAINGDISATAIPAVSATATDNKVIIINRGTGGGIAARPWIKARFTRNTTGGYTVQFGTITQTTGFYTLDVAKNSDYHFTFASFDNGGKVVTVQPKKKEWDFAWGFSVYEANFGSGLVPYGFSDMIMLNYLSGVQAAEKVYASSTDATTAFDKFNKDSVNASTTVFSSNRWAIGSKWRSTQPATGARQDRFYIVKDPVGNFYKLKFISMGVGTDGGERGKPKFNYVLIK
jgi:hypothetical protein